MNKTLIYHGSSEIVESPEIRIAKFNKDFYFGFYCTIMQEQARRWATRYGRGGSTMKTDDNLFFVCSLIEFIARQTHNCRNDIVKQLGEDVKQIYEYADVFHCEPIAKVADDFIKKNHITNGEYDNISSCCYMVPDYWDIGEVFARLIMDCHEKDDVIEDLKEVYGSWITENIMNFNSDLYYQSRDYLAECYRAGEILLG